MIIQGDRAVGGLDLPAPAESFVNEFNREYAALGLRVEILDAAHATPGPVTPQQQLASPALAGA
jgi:hypothetical protein